MLDLFTAGLTIEEQIEIVRTDITNTYVKEGKITKRTKIKLFYGDHKDFGNNVTIVTPQPAAKPFDSQDDRKLFQLLAEFGIDKYFITYNNLLPGIKFSKQETKDFGYWVRKIIDILDPKILVCMGEDSQLSFFKRKFVLKEHHGKLIGDYNSIPIFTAYPIVYYTQRSEFEDTSYKDFMKNLDWSVVAKKYKEVINVKSS